MPRAVVALAEREAISLGTAVGKRDLERAVGDGAGLANQLIEPLVVKRAVSLLVDVAAVSCARRLAIQQQLKSHRVTSRRRAHDQVEITCVEAIDERPAGLSDPGCLTPHRPFTGQAPAIEP